MAKGSKSVSLTCKTGYTEAVIIRNLHGVCTSRKAMEAHGLWASQRWRTRSFNRRCGWCWNLFTRRSFSASRMGFGLVVRNTGALDAFAVAIGQKVSWVLDADIRPYFDSIKHEWMQRFLEHRIGDRRLMRLLMKWLNAGVMEDGELREMAERTPQGGDSPGRTRHRSTSIPASSPRRSARTVTFAPARA